MRRGFTLLEVLVSLVVFGLAAVVLGSAYLNVLNVYDLAGRGTQGDENVRFARSLLLAEPDRETAERGDDFEASDGARVKWHAKIEQTGTADLYRVTFVCELSDPHATGNSRSVTETFMVLRPTWSQGLDTTKLRQDAKERILALQSKVSP